MYVPTLPALQIEILVTMLYDVRRGNGEKLLTVHAFGRGSGTPISACATKEVEASLSFCVTFDARLALAPPGYNTVVNFLCAVNSPVEGGFCFSHQS